MDMSNDITLAAGQEASRGLGIAKPGEFLTFRIGNEEYGIDILKVQEIRSYEEPTHIANAANWVKGVVNLRGVIVPILDLRVQLSCPVVEYTPLTAVVVLNIAGHVVGAVVDSVSDVLELSAKQILPAPEMSYTSNMEYITGLGTAGARMVILIDIATLLGGPAALSSFAG